MIAYVRANDVSGPVAQSETQLGARFDIKAFHDEILNGGALPLDLLEARTDRWIRSQLPQDAAAKP